MMGPLTLERAACRPVDTRVFFPTGDPGRGRDTSADHAKTVCARCPVIAECERDHKDEPFGVWFATTPRERGFARSTAKPRTVVCGDLIVDIMFAHQARWFTSTELAGWVPRNRDTVQHALRRLVAAGDVVCQPQPDNRPHLYRWAS